MTIGGGGGGGQPISISATSTSRDLPETTIQPDTVTTARQQTIYRRHFEPLITYCSLLHKSMSKLTSNPPNTQFGRRFLTPPAMQIMFCPLLYKGTTRQKSNIFIESLPDSHRVEKIKDGGLSRILCRFQLIRRIV